MKVSLVATLATSPVLLLAAPAAIADASVPSVSGDVFLGIGAVAAAVIIWIVIRVALNMSRNDGGDDDKAGVGVLDGIDEDDDRKK